MKQNKGFMLFETLVVSTLVLGTLVFLYVQISAIRRTYETSFKYNTISGLYQARELAEFIKKDGYQNIEQALENKNYVNITNCLYSSSMCKKILNNIDAKTVIFIGSNIENLKTELNGTYDENLFNENLKKFILQLSSVEAGRNRIIIEFKNNTFATVTIGDDTSQEHAITNLLKNSGFEDNSEVGLSYWNNYLTDVNITNENKYYGNYSMKYTSNEEITDNGIYQDVELKAGHTYYASEYIYLNSIPTNNSEFDLNGTTDYGNISLNNLRSSEWKRLSFTFTSDASGNYNFRTGNFTNDEVTLYIDNTMLIDLTETFGVGNEPTQDWCDSHISYFEGTSSIYK